MKNYKSVAISVALSAAVAMAVVYMSNNNIMGTGDLLAKKGWF